MSYISNWFWHAGFDVLNAAIWSSSKGCSTTLLWQGHIHTRLTCWLHQCCSFCGFQQRLIWNCFCDLKVRLQFSCEHFSVQLWTFPLPAFSGGDTCRIPASTPVVCWSVNLFDCHAHYKWLVSSWFDYDAVQRVLVTLSSQSIPLSATPTKCHW